MNKLNVFLAVIVLATTTSSAGAQVERASKRFAGYNLSEYVLESASVRFYMRDDTSGTAVARECRTCPPVRLTITPGMALEVGGQAVPWNASINLSDDLVDVFYDAQSKNINRLVVQ